MLSGLRYIQRQPFVTVGLIDVDITQLQAGEVLYLDCRQLKLHDQLAFGFQWVVDDQVVLKPTTIPPNMEAPFVHLNADKLAKLRSGLVAAFPVPTKCCGVVTLELFVAADAKAAAERVERLIPRFHV